MKKILVTTDLSANSKAGIRLALQIQKQTGCSLVFYHAIEIMKPTSWNDKRYKLFAEEKNAEFVSRLIGFVQDLTAAAGRPAGTISYKTEIGTRVAEMTIACAKAVKADLICLGTRGGGKMEKLLGSVASSLLVSSPFPVIVVPARYRAEQVNHLYYASDLEGFAGELKQVQSFASRLSARITVLHYDYQLMDRSKVTSLEARYARYEKAGVQFSFRKRDSDAALSDCIRADIKKEKPSMLVLFTKLNKSWFRRLFTPSRTRQLALHPTLPLLVFRKKGSSADK